MAIEVTMDGRSREDRLVIKFSLSDGSYIEMCMMRSGDEEAWDEFTNLVSNLDDVLDSMFETEEEGEYTVRKGKGVSIITEHISEEK